MRRILAPLVPVLALLFFGCEVPDVTEASSMEAAIQQEPMQTLTDVVEKLDDRLDALVDEGAELEQLAEGFEWSEGPVWRPASGDLLFTDIPKNTIYRWTDADGLEVFMRPAGYMMDDPQGRELGVNGLMLDAEGRLVMCDHGQRAISRLNEDNFTKTFLVRTYEDKRLNSPNDLVFHSNGALYFTDPPYGLEGINESPHKELDFNGVYRLDPDGALTLLTEEMSFPNGIGLSPDEQVLYVANSDPSRPVWQAFDVAADGSLSNSRTLFDAAALVAEGRRGAPDGFAVDQDGNLFATGPGGVLVIAPDGTHLGTIRMNQATANCTFGDDGSSLYITSDSYLFRIRLKTRGKGV